MPESTLPDSVPSLEAHLVALGGEETADRVDALNALTEALPRWSDVGRRLALATEARALAGRVGHTTGYVSATVAVGYAHLLLNDPISALPFFLEAEEQESLLPETIALWMQTGLASVYSDLGDFESVLRTLSALLDRVRTAGNREIEAWTLHGLSTAASDLGDAAGGVSFGEQSLAAFARLGLETGTQKAHVALGTACRMLGRLGEARAHHESSLAMSRALGDASAEARSLHDLAVLALAEERPDDALLLLRVALDRRRALGNRQAEATSRLELGRAEHAAGRHTDALATIQDALALADSLGAKLPASRAHLALADVYESLGRTGPALRHLRRYQETREEILGSEAAARVRSVEAQAEARRARDESDRARRHAADVSLKNDELEALLTELQRTQARLVQSEKLAGLGRLTAGIAHEIKNPLNFVTNFARLSVEMAAELRQALAAGDAAAVRELSDDLGTNAATILRHGERADAIVAAMMAHARGGAGERRPTDVPALVRQAADRACQNRAADGATAAEVAFRLDPSVGVVTLVPEQVGAAVAALVDNALRAAEARAADASTDMPDGYVPAVTVALRDAGGVVEIAVEDAGAGMTDAVRARAFEPFFTTRAAGEGAGLGLSLAWDVASAHGGTLAATPVPGGGERFVLSLPTDAPALSAAPGVSP